MRSIRTRYIRSASLANTHKGIARALILATCFSVTLSPVSATIIAPIGSLQPQLKHDSPITEVAVRRTTVVGPRGGAASRTVVRGGAVVRPGVARPGGWVRPANYYWRPGGAIAAGAAIGFVAAATAAAWAGAPPAPGYCWYYSDPSRTQGFWDVCP
jgi:hypothetical protein